MKHNRMAWKTRWALRLAVSFWLLLVVLLAASGCIPDWPGAENVGETQPTQEAIYPLPQDPSPTAENPLVDDYPPVQDPGSPTDVIPGDAYPVEGPREATFYPMSPPTAVTAIIPATVESLTPVPPSGWPTDQPWPPNTATIGPPPPTPTVFPFPPVSVPTLDADVPRDQLSSLWYVAYPGIHARPMIEELRVDDRGYHQVGQERSFDVDLLESPMYLDSPLYQMIPSPDGSRIFLDISHEEIVFPHILDLSSGNLMDDVVGIAAVNQGFFGWFPDGRRIMGTRPSLEEPYTIVQSLDLVSGTAEIFEYEDRDEGRLEVNAMAVSPDGQRLADAVAVIEKTGRSKGVEIGITDLQTRTRSVLAWLDQVNSVKRHSLKWSPDGTKLTWTVSLYLDGDQSASNGQDRLWVADIGAKTSWEAAHVRVGPGWNFPGGSIGSWSPDGRSIVFVCGEVEPATLTAGNVCLLDVQTGEVRTLTGYKNKTITYPQFSPDGRLVAYGIRNGRYGEIWVTSLDGAVSYPIAGPTGPEAAFAWVKN